MTHINSLAPMLQTRDLPKTIAFYTDILGFKVEGSWPEGPSPTWCMLRANDASLMFSTYEAAEEPNMTGSLYLYPQDIDALWEHVKDAAEVDAPLRTTEYGMREFVVHDPNGYHLAFGVSAEPHEHPHDGNDSHEH